MAVRMDRPVDDLAGAHVLARPAGHELAAVVAILALDVAGVGVLDCFLGKPGRLRERIAQHRFEVPSLHGQPLQLNATVSIGLAALKSGESTHSFLQRADSALLEAGIPPAGYRRIDQLAFDHERRLMSTLIETPVGKRLLITKGAPESVLERCVSVPAAARATLDREFATGARVVAVATKPWEGSANCGLDDERDLELAGFITFLDAPKADAADSLEQLKRLRIEVKIVTGDNPIVAQTVCRALRVDYFPLD